MIHIDNSFDRGIQSVPQSRVSPFFIALGALTIVGMSLSPSPFVVLASGIVFILILLLLWQHPALLVLAILQFFEVSLKPLATAFTFTPLQEFAEFDAILQPAALFGLAGMAALVVGQRIGAGQATKPNHEAIAATTESWSHERIVAFSLIAILLGHALDMSAGIFGGVDQIVLALSGVKFVGIFVLVYMTLRMRKSLRMVAAVVGLELLLGMTGFFSDFRLVLFAAIGAALAGHERLRGREAGVLVIGAFITINLAVFWSAVKGDYRVFLNQGTGAQVVLQPLVERLAYLTNEVVEFDLQKFANGFEMFFKRLSYIDFLAATMENVPVVIPHEGGAQLGGAILHIITPRILFPDKPPVPFNSEVTAYYTGLPIYLRDEVSISIGYLGELYIDFGIAGALLAVFLFGLAFGRCFRAIRDYPRTPYFINYGLCMMFALAWTSFGSALIKLVGGMVMVMIAALLLQRWGWPILISTGLVAPVKKEGP